MTNDNNQKVDTKSFGERLRQRLSELGMTSSELASKAGMDVATFHKLQKGMAVPRADHLLRLAKALGVRPEYLLWGEEGGEK